jgi:2-polyprenyl-3-methyl-5-hydroxy-6-metoxy-1,4-benzoquinol methylase
MTPGMSSPRNEADHQARYEFAKKFADRKRVLDVACGTGFGSKALAESGAEVVAIDIDEGAITYARENFAHEKVTYEVGDASDITHEDESFDLVVSFETIEHLPEALRAKYLRELGRVLRPDGKLILSTPNKPITSPWSFKPSNKHHVKEFTRSSLDRELSENGLTIEKWYGQRHIEKWRALRPVRFLEVLWCRFNGKTSERFYEADGPEVREIPSTHTVRYYVVIASKKDE